MRAPKTIAASAMIVLAQPIGAEGEESVPSLPAKTLRSQAVSAPARPIFFRLQAILAKKREQRGALQHQRAASPDEIACEPREQMSEMKAAASACRQEFSESLENAKAKAQEQARKLAEETMEVLRSGGPSADQ